MNLGVVKCPNTSGVDLCYQNAIFLSERRGRAG